MVVKFCAHLGYKFQEVELLKRFEAAKKCGFELVEHPSPFSINAKDLKSILDDIGLGICQISSGSGGSGLKGLACIERSKNAFRDHILTALDYAEEIGSQFVHPMSGITMAGVSNKDHEENWIENISLAMELAKNRSPNIIVEAISCNTVKGYFLNRLDQIESLFGSFSTQPFVLVDSYHAACNKESAVAFVQNNAKMVGHIHIADFPGRGEPGTGQLNFKVLADALDDIDYKGAIGCEYQPFGDTKQGLSWRESWPEFLK